MRTVVMVAPIPPPYGGIANWVQLMDRYVQKKTGTEFVHINTAPNREVWMGVPFGIVLWSADWICCEKTVNSGKCSLKTHRM